MAEPKVASRKIWGSGYPMYADGRFPVGRAYWARFELTYRSEDFTIRTVRLTPEVTCDAPR